MSSGPSYAERHDRGARVRSSFPRRAHAEPATNGTPLYAQVESVLAEDMADGRLPVGAQVPSEDSLCERFAVSRPTIRKAIENLRARGLLEIRRGKGTFVVEPKITQELTALTGFVEDMQALGRAPSARVIEKRLVAAGTVVAQHLRIPAGELVVKIRRLRLADGKPVSLDETYLPRDIGEPIMTDNLEVEPIFTLLEQKYDVPLVEATYRLEAVSADPQIAEALEIEAGSPLFMIERTSYGRENRPIDFERLHYRGDKIRFMTRLSRRSTRTGPVRAAKTPRQRGRAR